MENYIRLNDIDRKIKMRLFEVQSHSDRGKINNKRDFDQIISPYHNYLFTFR